MKNKILMDEYIPLGDSRYMVGIAKHFLLLKISHSICIFSHSLCTHLRKILICLYKKFLYSKIPLSVYIHSSEFDFPADCPFIISDEHPGCDR